MKRLELSNAAILDTETTGLDEWAEVCEVSIIDALHGNVLYSSFIRTAKPIPSDATSIHGITFDDVRYAPTIVEAWPEIQSVLSDRKLLIYNEDFDIRLLEQSLRYSGVELASIVAQRDFLNSLEIDCVMLWYAEFYGDWNDHHENYKWQSLTNACRQQGVDTSDLTAHRALADCEMTRRLVHAVNAQIQA